MEICMPSCNVGQPVQRQNCVPGAGEIVNLTLVAEGRQGGHLSLGYKKGSQGGGEKKGVGHD